ncbi:hypothetical protein ACFX2I_045441 [Malus domestica]
MKLSKRCERGAILQFEGMFCLGVAGADQLPYKMDLLLRCYNWLLSLICRLSCGGDLIRSTLELPKYQWIISQWKCHAKGQKTPSLMAAEDITGLKLEFPWQQSVYRHSEECSFILFLACISFETFSGEFLVAVTDVFSSGWPRNLSSLKAFLLIERHILVPKG